MNIYLGYNGTNKIEFVKNISVFVDYSFQINRDIISRNEEQYIVYSINIFLGDIKISKINICSFKTMSATVLYHPPILFCKTSITVENCHIALNYDAIEDLKKTLVELDKRAINDPNLITRAVVTSSKISWCELLCNIYNITTTIIYLSLLCIAIYLLIINHHTY